MNHRFISSKQIYIIIIIKVMWKERKNVCLLIEFVAQMSLQFWNGMAYRRKRRTERKL